MTSSKFATIHGGLLARKGEAAPAVRHSHVHVSYSDGHAPVAGAVPAPPPVAPRPVLPMLDVTFGDTRVPEPVAKAPCAGPDQSPKLGQACERKIPVGVGDGPGGRVSMRLTQRQKRMVTIASAVLGRSQQKLLSDALDAHLARLGSGEMKSCGCFTEQLRRRQDPAD